MSPRLSSYAGSCTVRRLLCNWKQIIINTNVPSTPREIGKREKNAKYLVLALLRWDIGAAAARCSNMSFMSSKYTDVSLFIDILLLSLWWIRFRCQRSDCAFWIFLFQCHLSHVFLCVPGGSLLEYTIMCFWFEVTHRLFCIVLDILLSGLSM